MFMMTVGFPLAFALILSVVAHAIATARRTASIWTAVIFALLYVVYMCVLAGGWRSHFPILAFGAFLVGLIAASGVGLIARKGTPV